MHVKNIFCARRSRIFLKWRIFTKGCQLSFRFRPKYFSRTWALECVVCFFKDDNNISSYTLFDTTRETTNVSLSEYSHHLSQFLDARQKFDGRCAIVNRNIKLPFGESLSFFLLFLCAGHISCFAKLDSGLEMPLVATQGTRSHLSRMNSFDGGTDSYHGEGGSVAIYCF